MILTDDVTLTESSKSSMQPFSKLLMHALLGELGLTASHTGNELENLQNDLARREVESHQFQDNNKAIKSKSQIP
jgi:hypothetical protein